MKKPLLLFATALGAAFLSSNWTQSAPLQSGSPQSHDRASFRIVFGEKQGRSLDYSGSISLSEGKVVGLKPWRFFGGDAAQGVDQWKLTTKRSLFESQPDQPRPLSTPGQMPML